MAYPEITTLDLQLFCRAIGLVGFAIYVIGFLGLSLGRLDSSQPWYFAMVLAASSCVMVSLWADFNLSAALIQGFYIVLSLGGLILRRQRRRDHKGPGKRQDKRRGKAPIQHRGIRTPSGW